VTDDLDYRPAGFQPPPPDRSGTEWRVPENQGAAPPPATVWPFDVSKLLALMEKSNQAALLRRDLAERVREARSKLTRLRIAAEQEVRSYSEVHWATAGALDAAQAELDRLTAGQTALTEQTTDSIGVAATCERWARQQGWTPDGRHGVTPPPRVGDEGRPPMLDTWKR